MYKVAKDNITVQVTLDRRRAKMDGKFPVKIQVVCKKVQKYYSTGKTLSLDEWERMPTTKTKSLLETRKSIESSFSIVRDAVEDLANAGNFSFGELNLRLGRGHTGSLNAAFQSKIDQLNANGQIGTRNMYVTILKGIERFGGTNISFDSITEDWLKKYEKFLVKEEKSWATIGMHFRHLRAIVNEAIKSGDMKQANYPFGKGKFEIKSAEGRKIALTLSQIGQIARFECESPVTEKYRDYWLFIYFCNGINVADFIKLKYKNIVGDEICFVRQKTEHTTKIQKEIHVALIPQMVDIIKKWGNPPQPDNYIFPVLNPGDRDSETLFVKKNNFNREINKRMKSIADALGFPKLSTYVARHSFATVLKRSGANIAYISESMGHTDLKTTEHYLASFEQEERMKNTMLLT